MTSPRFTAGGGRRGPDPQQIHTHSSGAAPAYPAAAQTHIPAPHWRLRPADNTSQFVFTGVEVVRVALPAAQPTTERASAAWWQRMVPPTLQPFAQQESRVLLALVLITSVLAGIGVFGQALLLRALMDLGAAIADAPARALVIGLLLGFAVTLLILKWLMYRGTMRIGHRLDARLRLALLTLLPQFTPGFAQHITLGDLFERVHSLQAVRQLPNYTVEVLQLGWQLVFTLVGLLLIDPLIGLLGVLRLGLLAAAVGFNRVPNALRTEARYYQGRLSRFYLDVLHGLVPIRAHQAEAAVQHEYRAQLWRWGRAQWRLLEFEFWLVAAARIVSHLVIAAMIVVFATSAATLPNWLLLIFWAFNLDIIGQQLLDAVLFFQRDQLKVTRYAEILNTPPTEAPAAANAARKPPQSTAGAALTLRNVALHKGRQPILRDLNFEIAAGQHVAVLGPSGAGKSSLMGLLLGLDQPTAGTILIDDQPLDAAGWRALREQIVWVAADVRLWNQALLANLQFSGQTVPVRTVIQAADLLTLLEGAGRGLQTPLGEAGRRISGGEGARVRFGRALQIPQARLVILDEPFVSLDPPRRKALLKHARTYWSNATLLYVTHAPEEAGDFDHVLIMAGGALVEAADAAALREQPGSQFQQMRAASATARQTIWGAAAWQRWRLGNGKLRDPLS
ncbi:MAG: ATP-binding cassette domain-containing protein [Chloroflexi bacterium]|nr:ATP-binding cassette domain-containing protein [Chloroflexota bacterium]